MQAPTSDAGVFIVGPSEVFLGGDLPGRGGPEPGYHVKVTTHTTGSKGADTKYKVFWAEACDAPPVNL